MNRKTLAAAFPHTVPVLMGYLSIGIVFGWMLSAAGFHPVWSLIMSSAIYAGSGQYLGVQLLAHLRWRTPPFSPWCSISGTWYTGCPCWKNSRAWAGGSCT